MNSLLDPQDPNSELAHVRSDELPEPPDFSRVVNHDALTPEVVDLISSLESFQ